MVDTRSVRKTAYADSSADGRSRPVRPRWDGRCLELRFGDALVKEFRKHSPN